MSVVFAVGSEDAFSSAVAWCQKFAEQGSTQVHVAVVGLDRKVLLEHVKNSVSDQFKPSGLDYSVQAVGDTPEALLQYVRDVGAKTLLLPHYADGDDFEQTVFEKSPICTVWLRAAGPPPQSVGQISVGIGTNSFLATAVSQQLFGLIPERVLSDAATESSPEDILNQVHETFDQADAGHLVVFGFGETSKSNAAYSAARQLVENNGQLSIALVRGGDSLSKSLAARIQRWFARVAPPMDREQRLQLAQDLECNSNPNLEFFGLMSASSMLAAFGLLQDSAAVVIGAMLIAPLMTPILGAGMSLAHGNRPLFRSALLTIFLGFVAALVASILFGWLVWAVRPHEADHLNWVTKEMWARCRPSPLDFCVGLVGGLAASYARSRSHLSSALAGAAIAAALVPPLATAGLQLSFGLWGKHNQGVMVIGPLLLVTINVLTIMIGSSFMLWARGMRGDRQANQKEKWAVRMVALLLVITALVLVLSLDPDMMFPT